VATGENATKVTALPVLAVTSSSSSGAAPYTLTSIDNIITYQGELGEKATTLLPIVAKAYTKYTAVYNEDKTLASVKIEYNQYEPQAYSYDEATKTAVMYWQDMTPYVAPAAE
ncbi:MAG: hypothetical protein ACI4EA_05145, partial [Candidatus Ornithomonoglobus sp.]